MDYQLLYVKGNYSDKKRMKGIYRFVKRVYRNVIERCLPDGFQEDSQNGLQEDLQKKEFLKEKNHILCPVWLLPSRIYRLRMEGPRIRRENQ